MPLNLGAWDPNSPLNPNNPANATPETITEQQALASQLLKGSMGGLPVGRSGSFEAVSPLGGISNMAQALIGSNMLGRTGQLQRGLQAEGAELQRQVPIPNAPGVSSGKSAETANFIRDAAVQHGYNDPNIPVHVASTEGLNSYVGDEGSSFGPFQLHYGGMVAGPNSVSGLGDQFTKETGLHAADPRTVPQQVHWVLDHVKNSGEGWAPFHGWKGDQYAGIPTAGAQAAPQGGVGATRLAFAGEPGQAPLNPPGSPQGMATALAGDVVAKGGPAVAPAAPSQPGVGLPGQYGLQPGQIVPPSLVPQRQQISDDLYKKILSLPKGVLPQNYIDWVINSRQGQYQPQGLSLGAYGNIMVGPQGRGPQFWSPTMQQYEEETGPLKEKGQQYLAPPGVGPAQQPSVTRVRPTVQSGPPPATGQPASATPATGEGPWGKLYQPATGQYISVPGPAAGSAASPLDNVSPVLTPEDASLPGAPGKGSQNEAPSNIKLAARETGTMTDAPTMLGVKPPAATPVAIPEAPPAVGPKVAEYQGKTLDQMTREEKLEFLKDYDVRKAGETQGTEAAWKGADKFKEDIQSRGQAAAQTMAPKLKIMNQIVNSPDYVSGPFSPLILLKNRLIAALGGDPKSAAMQEMANKEINDINLDVLKQKTQGFGQVRVFEGDMVKSAFANQENSIAANKALVTLATRVNERNIEAADMVNKYVMAHGGVADPSLPVRLFNYFNEKNPDGSMKRPLMSPQEEQKFLNDITTEVEMQKKDKAGGAPVGGPPAAPAGPSPAQQILERKKQQQQQIPL